MEERMERARNTRLEIPGIYPRVHTMVLARGQEYSHCRLVMGQTIRELFGQDTRLFVPFPFLVLFMPDNAVHGIMSADKPDKSE
jgi:hypothetical protein